MNMYEKAKEKAEQVMDAASERFTGGNEGETQELGQRAQARGADMEQDARDRFQGEQQ